MKGYGKNIMKIRKILAYGLLGLAVSVIMPMRVSAEESDELTIPTCYEDGSISPVRTDGKDIFANGTSLIFKDGRMYEDLAPYGEFNENDRHIYTGGYLEEDTDLFDGKQEMDLTYSYIYTGGIDNSQYTGEYYITVENTTVRGIYVDHVENATIHINHSNVLRNYIKNTTGDVNYTIENNADAVQEIYCQDLISGENGGLIQGNLNLTLNNIKVSPNCTILTSGTVCGDTKIVVNHSEIKGIDAAHITGTDTKKGDVYVEVNDSVLSYINGTSTGYYGNAANVNGDIDIHVNNSTLTGGIYKYASNYNYISLDNYTYKNVVTGKGIVHITNSTVRDVIDKGGYANKNFMSDDAMVIVDNAQISNLTCNQLNVKGQYIMNYMVTRNVCLENGTLVFDQSAHPHSAYINGQISGKGNFWINIKKQSQHIYFKGNAPIAKGTLIKLVPVHDENEKYIPYTQTEDLPQKVSFSFQKSGDYTGYKQYFTCDNFDIQETTEEDMSTISLVKKTAQTVTAPKKPTLISVKSKNKKTITVKWKKDKTVTGYKIQYSTNKKFKKGVKKITIKKNKTTSAKIKKLKSKKVYYVRIAAYKKVEGVTYTSAYTKAKKVKVK